MHRNLLRYKYIFLFKERHLQKIKKYKHKPKVKRIYSNYCKIKKETVKVRNIWKEIV